MRVLLKNLGVLHCVKVEHAYLNSEDNELILENSEHSFTVKNITQINGESAIRTLFRDGTLDLSMYQSYMDDENDEEGSLWLNW